MEFRAKHLSGISLMFPHDVGREDRLLLQKLFFHRESIPSQLWIFLIWFLSKANCWISRTLPQLSGRDSILLLEKAPAPMNDTSPQLSGMDSTLEPEKAYPPIEDTFPHLLGREKLSLTTWKKADFPMDVTSPQSPGIGE